MPNVTDLAAMLDGLQPGQLNKLPRSSLEKLSDACYRAHALCEAAAGQEAFTGVVRRYEQPKLYVASDAKERIQRQQTGGVLADLSNGHRVE
jgi:hypothetical protein